MKYRTLGPRMAMLSRERAEGAFRMVSLTDLRWVFICGSTADQSALHSTFEAGTS